MRVSLAVAAFVAALPAQVAPTPMFSPWYAEALRDILKLEDSEVPPLERKLAANPQDFPTRLKLMAYELRADRVNHPEDRARRVQHVLWLIQHHPESELLHSYVSRVSKRDLGEGAYQRIVALWDAASKSKPRDAAVLWNAASFFQELDPELY